MKRSLILTCATAVLLPSLCGCRSPEEPSSPERYGEDTVTQAQSATSRISLIPAPAELTMEARGPFELSGRSCIVVETAAAKAAAKLFAERLDKGAGLSFRFCSEAGAVPEGRNAIRFVEEPFADPEAYSLCVAPDVVTLSGCDAKGFFYAVQTLLQLLPPKAAYGSGAAGPISIPSLTIRDYPAGRWRGLMMDCSSRYYDVAFLKKVLDVMAAHKLNVFHWKLSGNSGWRLEVDSYPKLAKKASADPRVREGGIFYTKDNIREIINYAAARHITVVPGIAFPDDSLAVSEVQGLNCHSGSEQLCIGNEGKTLEFLKNVIGDISRQFPSEFIVLGGEAFDQTVWNTCPRCRAFMRQHQLKGADQLAGYVLNELNAAARIHGRTLVSGDAVFAGGNTDGNAVVISERSATAPPATFSLLSSDPQLVFANPQSKSPDEPAFSPNTRPIVTLEEVYAVKLPDSALTLGGEGRLVSRKITSDEEAAYLLAPRVAALSEVLWTPAAQKDYARFSQALTTQLARYETLGFAARQPQVVIAIAEDGKVTLSPELPGSEMSFSIDQPLTEAVGTTYDSKNPPVLTDGQTIFAAIHGTTAQGEKRLLAVNDQAFFSIKADLISAPPSIPGHSEALAVDGNMETFYLSNANLRTGDELIFQLREAVHPISVSVASGVSRGKFLVQKVSDATLDYSTDGENFVACSSFLSDGSCYALLPANTKAVRIHVTRPTVEPVAVREVLFALTPEQDASFRRGHFQKIGKDEPEAQR